MNFTNSTYPDFRILQGDCMERLNEIEDNSIDAIFADPPYMLEELPLLPNYIFERQLLKEGGLFVLEHGKAYDFSQHPHFAEHRAYGNVHFSFFK